jgi:hypothetical protein
MKNETPDAWIERRDDPMFMGPKDGEPDIDEEEECEHEELDHCVCLHCGKELDAGDVYGGAIDRATDLIDEQNNQLKRK